jgi:hypothetical protein
VVNELREDFQFNESDSISIYLDSLHDRRSGFALSANPAGARRDSQIANDSQFNNDWDGVWDVRVRRTDDAWYAEFMIPFKTLRFSPGQVQEWGLNISRRVLRRNEESFWSPLPIRYTGARVSLAGTLKGLQNISQGRNLKVKPFVTGGITQVRQGSELRTLHDLGRLKDYDGGVDIKYSLTPSLTLDGTYRTDFAQVEVDQQQVNLTRFSLFFPEKRDFFLENAGTFGFGPGGNLVPFFSRRIGLSAGGTPIPILGGTRVSGKAGRYDIGLLGMRTEQLRTLTSTTPSNNYLVGRIKRNLLTNSWVGTLVTHRDSSMRGDFNRVYGADAHFQFYQRLEFDAYLLKSATQGRSGKEQARHFQTTWRDDELIIIGEYNAVQPNFNPEVGFLRRQNMTQYLGDIAWRPQLVRNDVIRNLTFQTSVDYYERADTGTIETRVQELTLGVDFENNAAIGFTMNDTFDRLAEPFPIRTNVSIAEGDYRYRGYTGTVRTNPSAKVRGNASLEWGEFWNGDRTSFTGAVTVRPSYRLSLELNYGHNHVDLPSGPFTTDLIGTRFLYAFSPRAFLNGFIQYNADTHQVSSNIRFNIMHRPLSDLYVVYNDRRDTAAGHVLERALIVKLTNLFNF